MQELAVHRNAARYEYLQSIDPREAQAFFWNFSSRKERSKAIDVAISAKNQLEKNL